VLEPCVHWRGHSGEWRMRNKKGFSCFRGALDGFGTGDQLALESVTGLVFSMIEQFVQCVVTPFD
ncbi:MAG: hypothetical protein ACRD2L_12625, partial [Terriglobia bacterium]